jgi:hypothetical protein
MEESGHEVVWFRKKKKNPGANDQRMCVKKLRGEKKK